MPESRTENPAEKFKMGALMKPITIAELAEVYGRKPDTLYRKASRKWKDRKWSIFSEVTDDEGRFLLGDYPDESLKSGSGSLGFRLIKNRRQGNRRLRLALAENGPHLTGFCSGCLLRPFWRAFAMCTA